MIIFISDVCMKLFRIFFLLINGSSISFEANFSLLLLFFFLFVLVFFILIIYSFHFMLLVLGIL
jgi:hypothetical protein